MGKLNDYQMDSKQSKSYTPLENGLLVSCIILKRTFVPKLLNALEKENEKIEAEFAKVGKPEKFVAKEATVKNQGLAFLCTVVKSMEHSDLTLERYWQPDEEGNYIKPNFLSTFYISQPPPEEMLNKVMHNFPHYRLGVKKMGKRIGASPLFPNTIPIKDFDTGVVADDIPDGYQEIYRDLINQETKRLNDWKNIIELWHEASEEECIAFCEKMISQRFALCHKDEFGELIYHAPKVGMVFDGVVNFGKGDYFFNVDVVSNYNKSLKAYEIYSSLNTNEPEEIYVEAAKSMLETLENKIQDETPF